MEMAGSKDFSKTLVDPEEKGCKVSDYKVSGNKVTFKTTCEEDGLKTTSTATPPRSRSPAS